MQRISLIPRGPEVRRAVTLAGAFSAIALAFWGAQAGHATQFNAADLQVEAQVVNDDCIIIWGKAKNDG